MMLTQLFKVISLLAGAAVAAPAFAEAQRVEAQVGYAYARDSGVPLYTEHHRFVYRNGALATHRVDYRRADGAPIGTKELDYGEHPYAPDFRMVDLRDGYIEGAEHSAGGYRLYRQLGHRAPLEDQVVPQSLDLVADSGFDRYMRAHLQALMENGEGAIRLAVAGRLAAYGFRVQTRERERLFGRDAITLRVQIDSWLSWLVEPIDLTYDADNGRLLRYVGLSNIRSESGERYDARIDFPDPAIVDRGGAAAALP